MVWIVKLKCLKFFNFFRTLIEAEKFEKIQNFDRHFLGLFKKAEQEWIESDLKVVEVTLDLLEQWKDSLYDKKLSDDTIHDKIAIFHAMARKGKKRKAFKNAFKI